MAREDHIAAVDGSSENEVSVDFADVLRTLGAQDWDLRPPCHSRTATFCC